jgi:hypothetical protein
LANQATEAAQPRRPTLGRGSYHIHPEVAIAEHLAQQFRQVFKDQDSAALKSSLARSVASDIPELKRFGAGVQRDYEAVVAAVEQHWSNGQVERQVHRLKPPLQNPRFSALFVKLHQKCGRPFGVMTSGPVLT